MASPQASSNCLRELNKFTNILSYGFDLYDSSEALTSYCFGGTRTLNEVFATAVLDGSQLDECQCIVHDIIDHVTAEICNMIEREGSDVGLSLDEQNVLVERIKMFWEVDQTRSVKDLLNTDYLNKLDQNMEIIEKSLLEAGNSRISRLPAAFRARFHRGSPQLAPKKFLPLCVRDDIVLDVPKEKEPSPVVPGGPIGSFVHQYNQMIAKLEAVNYDFEAMTALSEMETAPELRLPEARIDELKPRLLSLWLPLVTFTDRRVRRGFLVMMRKFFSVISNEHKEKIFSAIYALHVESDDKDLPNFSNDFENFDENLTACLNRLGDHNDLQSNPEKFENVRRKLQWYLLISPKTTVHRLLIKCIDSKDVVPAVLKVMHATSSLFCVTLPNKMMGPQPLLTLALDNIFMGELERWDSFEMQDSFIYLVSSLCRRKRSVIKEKSPEGVTVSEKLGGVLDDSLLDGPDALSFLLVPHLMCPGTTRTHQIIMLKIMQRIFQNLGAKDTVFRWTTEIGQPWLGLGAVPAAEVLILVHDLMLQWEQTCQPISDICRLILKSLGAKLRDDEVIFNAKTTAFILDHLSKDAWWVRYGIVEWFAGCMGNPRQQLPGGLFLALPIAMQEKCDEIVADFESAPVNCLLRSLFELGLFEVEAAMELLDGGLSLRPTDDSLLEQIALALADVYGRSFKSQRVPALAPLLDRLIKLLDPCVHNHSSMEFLSESTFHGIRLIQPLLLIAKAGKISFAKLEHSDPSMQSHYPENSLDRPGSPREVADELLQAFCEMAKAHMDAEMVSLRRSHLPVPPTIKEERAFPVGVEMQRDQRVLIQLTLLFNEAILFTQLVGAKVPTGLRVLVVQLSERLKEVQDKQKGRFLDTAVIPSVKSKTAYVYANSSHPAPASESPSKIEKLSGNSVETPVGTSKSVASQNEEETGLSASNRLFVVKSPPTAIVPPSSSYCSSSNASVSSKYSVPPPNYRPLQQNQHRPQHCDGEIATISMRHDNIPSKSEAEYGNWCHSRRWREPHSLHPAERENWRPQTTRERPPTRERRGSEETAREDMDNGVRMRLENGVRHYTLAGSAGQESMSDGRYERREEYGSRREDYGRRREDYGRREDDYDNDYRNGWHDRDRRGGNYSTSTDNFQAMAGQISNPAFQQQVSRRLTNSSKSMENNGRNTWSGSTGNSYRNNGWQEGEEAGNRGGGGRISPSGGEGPRKSNYSSGRSNYGGGRRNNKNRY